jgi:poly(A) polymerase
VFSVSDLFVQYGEIFSAIQQVAGQPVYLVGGAVRDILLQRASNDLDFVVEENAQRIGRKVANALGGGFYMLDEVRDTSRVILHREAGRKLFLDFATFRAGDLMGDLLDRDFTINAMALDLSVHGEVIDPAGGREDLISKQIRPCSPRSLENDPVRVLRAVRLSLSLGFVIAPETEAAMRLAANRLARVSPERKRDELFRMLENSQIDQAVRLLDLYGALKAVLPEMEGLKGVTQSAPHIDNTWDHTLNVARQLQVLFNFLVNRSSVSAVDSENKLLSKAFQYLGRYQEKLASHFSSAISPNRSSRALLSFAALYHDIAKPLTRSQDADGKVHFYEHEHLGAKIIGQRAKALALSSAEVQRLVAVINGHMRIHHLSNSGQEPSRRAVYRFFRATQDVGIDIVLLSLADVLATYGPDIPMERWEAELSVASRMLEAWWETSQEVVSPVRLFDGSDLQKQFGLKPGPIIGDLLESLQEAQATGEVNTKEDALRFIENLLDKKKQASEMGQQKDREE